MAKYAIKVADPSIDPNFWVQPSELHPDFNDFEPSLDHAIKAQRFYERRLGLISKREKL